VNGIAEEVGILIMLDLILYNYLSLQFLAHRLHRLGVHKSAHDCSFFVEREWWNLQVIMDDPSFKRI